MFLNKCFIFTLSPMDVDIESSARIIYGYLKNTNKFDEILCQQISSKVALIHQEMNKKFTQNQEFFSGGVQFTGRIIKYIGEELSKSSDSTDLCEHLKDAFYLNYINSINNKNNKDNIKEVIEIIKQNLKKNYTFNFSNLLNLIKKVEINDLDFIYYYIEETINIVDEFVGDSIETRLKYFYYYNLEIIKNLIKNVLDYLKNNSKYSIVTDFTLNEEE